MVRIDKVLSISYCVDMERDESLLMYVSSVCFISIPTLHSPRTNLPIALICYAPLTKSRKDACLSTIRSFRVFVDLGKRSIIHNSDFRVRTERKELLSQGIHLSG